MSATKVLSQGNPSLLVSIPGFKAPVLLHLRATIAGASGAATIVSATSVSGQAPTSLDFTLTRQAAGTYDLVMNPCRAIAEGTVVINVIPPVVTVGADRRVPAIDKSTTNTNATTGKLRFNLVPPNNTTVTDPVDLSEIHMSFWVDLG